MKKFIGFLTAAAFLAMLLFPMFGLLLPGSRNAVNENRALADWPDDAPIGELPGALENWLGDHLAFRSEMLRFYNRYLSEAGQSLDGPVLEGLDGWYYYLYGHSKEDIARTIHYTPDEIDAICAAQQRTSDYLASLGIAYYLMVCPDKHSIYPEYLPAIWPLREGESRFDPLAEALKTQTSVHFVDSRSAVLAAKGERTLYYKTDTHWNEFGAFAGYTALATEIKSLFPNLRIVRETDCDLTLNDQWREGDMAEMLDMQDVLTDTDVSYTVRDADSVLLKSPYAETSEDPERPILVVENPDHPELPTAVIFRDSFCRMMYPMLASSFSRVVFVWSTSVLSSVVLTEMPDLVVMEYVERYSEFAGNGMDIPDEKCVPTGADYQMPSEMAAIRANVDSFDSSRDVCTLSGWGFMPYKDARMGEKQIVLEKDGEYVFCTTATVLRPDVAEAYRKDMPDCDLIESGFTAFFDQRSLAPGKWRLLLLIDDGEGNAGYVDLRKRVNIK